MVFMTFTSPDEAALYIDQMIETESLGRAEYGMGAVSLGYDPYDWATDYSGYRTAADPTFAAAEAFLAATAPAAPVATTTIDPDPSDLPF